MYAKTHICILLFFSLYIFIIIIIIIIIISPPFPTLKGDGDVA